MRNASLTNVAPTGTTSRIFDVNSGIEPIFALAYSRANCLGAGSVVVSPFLTAMGVTDEEVLVQVAKSGSVQGVDGVSPEAQRLLVTSLDISASDHCRMQAAVQKFCCNAISKTINFPNSATAQDMGAAFIEAWRLGAKGVTVYRSGSRHGEVQVIGKSEIPARTLGDVEAAPPGSSGCKNGLCDI
jgi:ribonucleoside-diphosphate reductase alpha chain